MFQFKNGRLYPEITPRRLSFKLPEGFWFETYPADLSDDCITLLSEEREVIIEVGVEAGIHEEDGTAVELEMEFDSTPPEELEGPFPITVGSGTDHELSGHYIYYTGHQQQCSIRLDTGKHGLLGWLTDEQDIAGEDDWFDRVYINITVNPNGGHSTESIKDLVQLPGVQELIQSVMVEPQKVKEKK